MTNQLRTGTKVLSLASGLVVLASLIMLSVASCTKESPTYCYECYAKGDTIHLFFCNSTEEEMQSVINYWKTSSIDTLTMKCKIVEDHHHF